MYAVLGDVGHRTDPPIPAWAAPNPFDIGCARSIILAHAAGRPLPRDPEKGALSEAGAGWAAGWVFQRHASVRFRWAATLPAPDLRRVRSVDYGACCD